MDLSPISNLGGTCMGAAPVEKLDKPDKHKSSSSSSSTGLKKLFVRAISGKALFKHKPRTPLEIIRQTRELLLYLDADSHEDSHKHASKMAELNKLLNEIKLILYGDSESVANPDACASVTQEIFGEDTLRLLIVSIPKLDLEGRIDATQVVANLQRQPVQYRLIASDYLEANLDLMDILILGYEDPVLGIHYGVMLRECIRHQVVARYVLASEHVKKFFDYTQLPNFDVASDALTTFKELLTRHKSSVAEFLSKNYDWFFADFNSKLLESANYITRRQAIKLLCEILLERSNTSIMVQYVSSKDNLRILMNLMRETSKSIPVDAFHVFKLFATNPNKPAEIVTILIANRSKLLRFFAGFKIDKEDEQFDADKAQVMKEIAELEGVESSGGL
ncbi:putative MO25-like protein At5g47540 [Impatiens glandulifera]|uniref:putative MO25-like protein At5g47540 n=1 Tax=Impatiens glandulifera TaxID=253017 RepID=UPI001FB105A2|nr:putative MO25-like protein At5g47540 [Impatiens glandulifera]